MSEENNIVELKEEDLEKVTGGAAYEYNGQQYNENTLFLTPQHPYTFCRVDHATSEGLWYVVGCDTDILSDTYASLNPISIQEWIEYSDKYQSINGVTPAEWAVIYPL